ncbi:MAG: hypothetical protein RSE01_01080 [Akkermansia sp.]
MKSRNYRGFTLTETVLAIGVVGVLLVVFVAMFFPARRAVQAALTVQESDRVVRMLTAELNVLRPGERADANARISTNKKYISAFDKAYYWMMGTAQPSTTILIYNYRGDLTKTLRQDGTYTPLFKSETIPGSGSVLVSAACRADNKERWEDFRAVVGPVFAVRMTQLIVRYESNKMKYELALEPGRIGNPYNYKSRISKPEDYVYNVKDKRGDVWGAEVMYYAEFFQLTSVDPARLSKTEWKKLKKPIFGRNLVFRR